ncbi:flagellar brake protein [Marinobacterium arenosum]|uniref:flagellar brake protein n=1 Tax=Marinobacterium arenosum TaxID=2862496 RepID=UPI001C96EA9C|nr:flagellar brake protein [Marinobacterium arenosum]MBY4678108.1 flagellar brake protein [Marinobacterium arenosum]
MSKALANHRPAITLASLKPPIGSPVQLESADLGRLGTRLLGYQEQGSLILATPKQAGRRVVLKSGALLNVRLITAVSLCTFSARLLAQARDPYPHWHLEYPPALEVSRIRQHARVPVNLAVSVDDYDEAGLGMASWPRTVFCRDISLRGASLLSSQPLGEVGERLYVTLRLTVAGEDQVLLTPALIRNVQPDGGAAGSLICGVEFFDLDEDARLVLAGFVYQQSLLEAGYGDYLAEVNR